MVINEIESGRQYLPLIQQEMRNQPPETKGGASFTDSLKELINDTNSLQKDAADLTDKMLKGEPVDIHDVMIATEKAKTSFQLLMEIRNRFLDLYKEVNRIQV